MIYRHIQVYLRPSMHNLISAWYHLWRLSPSQVGTASPEPSNLLGLASFAGCWGHLTCFAGWKQRGLGPKMTSNYWPWGPTTRTASSTTRSRSTGSQVATIINKPLLIILIVAKYHDNKWPLANSDTHHYQRLLANIIKYHYQSFTNHSSSINYCLSIS